MKNIIIVLLFNLSVYNSFSQDTNFIDITYPSAHISEVEVQTDFGIILGNIIDEQNEPVPFAEIKLINTKLGAILDINGDFKIDNIPAGKYSLHISAMEYSDTTLNEIIITNEKIIEIEPIPITIKNEIISLKPIIYLYPEKDQDITVSLNYDGNFTTTYPKISKNNDWTVHATKEGVITDKKNREYYALFWEGIPNIPLSLKEGQCISKENTITFLESKLDLLGLNARESNEFILFWLPILEKSPYNLISFSFEEYELQAELQITPKPDQIIRVMMVYQPLEEQIEIPLQILEPYLIKRQGFTVVEWGGQLGAYQEKISLNN